MNSHQTAREARSIVEAELKKRGAARVASFGTQKVFLEASGAEQNRTVRIQVKSKRKGKWHSNTSYSERIGDSPSIEDVRKFWIFVALEQPPRFWIVPDWWIRNDIHTAHDQYLKKHGGHRAQNDESDHHAIEESRLEQWQNKWEILNIF